MRYSLNERPVAKASIPTPTLQVNVEVDMPHEAVPPGVEQTLQTLGWYPEYCSGMDYTMFKRLDGVGPYAGGYYHWYEVVALESLNLLTIGKARDDANHRVSDGGVTAATGMR